MYQPFLLQILTSSKYSSFHSVFRYSEISSIRKIKGIFLFRIFCGDLGNDVTDELLTRTFNKYPSFQRAKVIRDKRTNKTKGYGFVSFKDPADFTKAMKEMDGKLIYYILIFWNDLFIK